MTASASHTTAHLMLDLLASLLAPFFLSVTGDDRARAQAVARETILSLQPGSIPDLLHAAQATGFSLGAVTALGQSAEPGLPEKQATSLRAQADRLGRSAARARKALKPLAPRPLAPKPQPRPAAPPPPAPPRADWAAAMEAISAELAAEAGQEAANRTAALRAAAQALRQPPRHAPPG